MEFSGMWCSLVIWRPAGACWATPEPATAGGCWRWRRKCWTPSVGTRCQCFPDSDLHRGQGPGRETN